MPVQASCPKRVVTLSTAPILARYSTWLPSERTCPATRRSPHSSTEARFAEQWLGDRSTYPRFPPLEPPRRTSAESADTRVAKELRRKCIESSCPFQRS